MNHDDPTDHPAHYRRTTPRQLAAQRARGRRHLGFGAVWLAVGLLVTITTMTAFAAEGWYLIAFGPIIGGVLQMVSGYRMFRAALGGAPDRGA